MSPGFLTHPLLAGTAHGFGLRESPPRPDVRRPQQVHGVAVAWVGSPADAPGEADAVVGTAAGVAVGVVSADCVPVLLAGADGAAVAAIHAGWRGLAAGVVAAGLRALRERSGAVAAAVIGPHVGAACYEVDAPVLEALGARFGAALEAAQRPTRPGHAQLDLGRLVREELEREGLAPGQVGGVTPSCTRCHAAQFHSYRRDGARAGRLLHWIAPA